MLTLSPQVFLNHLSSGVASSRFLGSVDQAIVAHCIDHAAGAGGFQDLSPVVRDVSFALARDFLKQIPGPLNARLFGPERLQEPIREPLAGGRSLQEGLFSHDEFVIEVRCPSEGFSDPEAVLPSSGNLEIALREMEEGLGLFGHLVLLGGLNGGGSWKPDEARTMAFRLVSPGLVMAELKKRHPEADLQPLYAGGLVSFRNYERSLSQASWPVGIPLDRQPVDAEGEQHAYYFLLHELGHASIRALRSPALRRAGLSLLRAGLSVFPEVDGLSPQKGTGQALERLFGRTIELRQVYFVEQLGQALNEATSTFLRGSPSLVDARRYFEFLGEAEGALRVTSVDHPEATWTGLWEAIRRSERAVQKHLEFYDSIR